MIAGAVGGVARTLFMVSKLLYKKEKVDGGHTLVVLVINVVFGALLAHVLQQGRIVSILLGWAAFDILDGLHKTVSIGPVKLPVKTIGIKNKKSFAQTIFDYR